MLAPWIAAVVAAAEPAPGLVVVIKGPAEYAAAATQGLSTLEPQFHIRVETLPRARIASNDSGEFQERLIRARRAYVNADFRACLDGLDETDLLPLLSTSQRTLAARLLFWRTACAVGRGDLPQAERSARRLWTLSLELPPEVDRVTPEVEALLARVRRESGSPPEKRLTVVAHRSDVTFWVDARLAQCSEPCSVMVAEGQHVVKVDALGATPVALWAQAGGPAVEVHLTASSPDEAAQQWAQTFGSLPLNTPSSLGLLSQALQSPRLVTIELDDLGRGPTLSGALTVEGVLKTRAERHSKDVSHLTEDGPGLVRDLLVLGKVVEPPLPLYKSPGLWIGVAIGAAAVAVGAGVFAANYKAPPVQTTVSIGR